MTTTKTNIAEVADQFAKDATEKFNNGYTYYVEKGRRFNKIVMERPQGGGRSVWAFVEITTGALIKAATWKAPQKNAKGEFAVRFMLDTDEGYKQAIDAADWTGGFLYAP